MTILNLNGYAVPIAANSLKRGAIEEIGPASDSYKGWSRDAVRARKRTWTGTIVLDLSATQESLEQLLLGRGHHFPFDTSLYSDKTGLGPNAGYAITLAAAAPAPKFGTNRLQVTSAGSIGWNCEVALATNTWSMTWWFSSGGAWDHWCVRSLAGVVTAYKNGSLIAAPGNYSVSVSGTTATFSLLGKDTAGANSASAFFDDLCIFPTTALSTALITSFSTATLAQSSLPYLNLTGDLLDEAGPVEVRGKLGEVRFIEATKGGAWQNDLRTIDFSLVESKPYR